MPDEEGNVTEYYETIRGSVAVDGTGVCHEIACKYLERLRRRYYFIVQGKCHCFLLYISECDDIAGTHTIFTPRDYPSWTNIVNILPPEQQSTLDITIHPIFNPSKTAL